MTSRQEQKWFKTFYEGTFMVKGWNAQTKELLQDFHGDERDVVNALLSDLGEKIGQEWSKDNTVRRIDTAKLKQWGASLSSARKKGPEVLTEEIQLISKTVDEILS